MRCYAVASIFSVFCFLLRRPPSRNNAAIDRFALVTVSRKRLVFVCGKLRTPSQRTIQFEMLENGSIQNFSFTFTNIDSHSSTFRRVGEQESDWRIRHWIQIVRELIDVLTGSIDWARISRRQVYSHTRMSRRWNVQRRVRSMHANETEQVSMNRCLIVRWYVFYSRAHTNMDLCDFEYARGGAVTAPPVTITPPSRLRPSRPPPIKFDVAP